MGKKIIDYFVSILIIILILFGTFIIYQLIRKILGGSWTTENIIIALLIFEIGLTFTIAVSLARLISDHNHLKGQFCSLAKDFKEHLSK